MNHRISLYYLVSIIGIIVLTATTACREAVNKETGAVIDTLSAVATDAQTVINSIKEKSFSNGDGYYFRQSPVYMTDSTTFYVECFFNSTNKIPELITHTILSSNGDLTVSNFLNQNNELFFAKFVEKNVSGIKEYRGFYQTEKLRFADLKTGANPAEFDKARSRLLKKEEFDTYNLSFENVTTKANSLLAAYQMKGDFGLTLDSLVSDNNSEIVYVSTSGVKSWTRFLVSKNNTSGIKSLIHKPVNIYYHYEGQDALADSLQAR